MREICLARLDKTRPVVVLTREGARSAMSKVTVAPITSTAKGLSSEVAVGPRNGLDQESVISVDNVTTIAKELLGPTIGYLRDDQEHQLAQAMVVSFDLDVPLLPASTHVRR